MIRRDAEQTQRKIKANHKTNTRLKTQMAQLLSFSEIDINEDRVSPIDILFIKGGDLVQTTTMRKVMQRVPRHTYNLSMEQQQKRTGEI